MKRDTSQKTGAGAQKKIRNIKKKYCRDQKITKHHRKITGHEACSFTGRNAMLCGIKNKLNLMFFESVWPLEKLNDVVRCFLVQIILFLSQLRFAFFQEPGRIWPV